MGAITGIVSLISSFLELILTGIDSIISFAKIAINYMQIFVSFLPVQLVSLFMIVIVSALIYLLVGR